MRVCATALLFLSFLPGHLAAQQKAKPEEVWDPYRAEKSIEIGRYYLKKGNYDAAIDRFLEAIHYRSDYALPRRLLGEAYEKKGEKQLAIEAYTKYLEILPQAEDAEKVRKKIRQLEKELAELKRQRKKSE